jgi:hypothetical protein
MIAASVSRPDTTEYAPYYGTYISLVPGGDILAILERQLADVNGLLRGVPEAVGNTRHPPYTWSVKEVVGHLIDSERVFGYRALRFARGDATPLPGFDENAYARAVQFDSYALAELLDEFELVRRSHLHLFRHLDAEAWGRQGVANEKPVSVRALAWILAGHVCHHLAILRKRLSPA